MPEFVIENIKVVCIAPGAYRLSVSLLESWAGSSIRHTVELLITDGDLKDPSKVEDMIVSKVSDLLPYFKKELGALQALSTLLHKKIQV